MEATIGGIQMSDAKLDAEQARQQRLKAGLTPNQTHPSTKKNMKNNQTTTLLGFKPVATGWDSNQATNTGIQPSDDRPDGQARRAAPQSGQPWNVNSI